MELGQTNNKLIDVENMLQYLVIDKQDAFYIWERDCHLWIYVKVRLSCVIFPLGFPPFSSNSLLGRAWEVWSCFGDSSFQMVNQWRLVRTNSMKLLHAETFIALDGPNIHRTNLASVVKLA